MSCKIFIIIITYFLYLFAGNSDFIKVKASEHKKIDIEVKRNKIKGSATIFMNINGKLTDSVTLTDLDFIIDSLVILNDSTWKYMYSLGFSETHGMVTARQILIHEFNNKIHFSLISLYKSYNIPIEPDDDFPFFYEWKNEYTLNLLDTFGYKIERKRYSKDIDIRAGETTIDSLYEHVYLKYDTDKKVFYTHKEILNGEFSFQAKEPKKRKHESSTTYVFIDNKEVYTLKIGQSHFIYYENKWFIMNEFPDWKRITPFLPFEQEDFKTE